MNTMDVGSVSQNALLGITRGLNQAARASGELASAKQLNGEQSLKDTAKNLVALKQAETQVQVSAKVAQTAGDIIGSLLDVTA